MMDRLGVQTFTVRQEMKTPKSLRKTLLALKDIGYTQFELARIKFSEAECQVLEALKDEHGFIYTTSQIKLKIIQKEFDWIIEFSKRLNIKTLEVSVIPMWAFRQGKSGMVKLAEELNALGERTKSEGIELLYHHHNFEMIKMGDRLGIEHLLDYLERDKANLVVDTYWLARSGIDPHKFIRDHESRVKGVHLRDSELLFKRYGFRFRDQVIGQGTIDFKPFYHNYEGIGFYSVEQDTNNPLVDLEKSYKYLRGLNHIDN